MSTPARIAERDDPLFRSCVAKLTTASRLAAAKGYTELPRSARFRAVMRMEANRLYVERQEAKRPEMLAALARGDEAA